MLSSHGRAGLRNLRREPRERRRGGGPVNHHKEERVKKTGVKQWDKGTAAACASVLAVVLLVVVLISWNIYDYSQSQELESQRYLMELGESLCHSVDGRLETSLKELEFIAGGYAGQAGPGQSIDPRLDLLGLSQVYILDGQGQWTGDGGRPVDFSTQPWAAAAPAGERVEARPHEAIAQLNERQKYLIEEIYFKERTCEDIAAELGVDGSAVRHALKRIRASIRKFFRENQKNFS